MKKLCAFVIVLALTVSALCGAASAETYGKSMVQSVQQMLNEAGYDCGTPDGVAGKKTAAAISAFQEDHGMEVTGEISYVLFLSLYLENYDIPTAQTAEDLKDPQIFNNTVWMNLKDRLTDAAGEENAEYAANALVAKYLLLPVMDTDGLFIFLGNQGRMMYYRDPDGTAGEPFGALYMVPTDDDDCIDFVAYAALSAFLEEANRIYGGSEEEFAEVMATLGDELAWDDRLPVDRRWGATIVLPLGTAEVSFGYPANAQICVASREHTADWEDLDVGVDFGGTNYGTDYGTGEEGREDMTYLEGDEIPDLPADILAVTGGLPDSIENIPMKDEIDEASALFAQVKPGDALTSLIENGSCEVPLPDDSAWTPEENIFFYVSNDDDECEERELQLSIADGIITVTFVNPLPEDSVYWEFECLYPNDILLDAVYVKEDGYSDATFELFNTIELESGNWKYSILGWNSAENVLIKLRLPGEADWYGEYDSDGLLLNKWYISYN